MDQKDKRNEQEVKEAKIKSEEMLTDEELNQVAAGNLPLLDLERKGEPGGYDI